MQGDGLSPHLDMSAPHLGVQYHVAVVVRVRTGCLHISKRKNRYCGCSMATIAKNRDPKCHICYYLNNKEAGVMVLECLVIVETHAHVEWVTHLRTCIVVMGGWRITVMIAN